MLDRYRRKRHLAIYEQIGAVSDQEAAEMIAAARRLRKPLMAWLRREHPDLVT